MITLLLLLAQSTVADGAIQPQVAADEQGQIYVTYVKGGNVIVKFSTDDAKTWSREWTAIDAKGKAKGGAQRGPRIGAHGKNGVVVTAPVCFDEKEFEKQYPTNELWIVRSTDMGQTWS